MPRLHALVALLAAFAWPAMAQETLRPGQTVTGELTTSDPTLDDGSHYDCFIVPTRQGQRLQIDLTSEAFDSYLTIGMGHCDLLFDAESDDDSGGGLNSRLVRVAPHATLTIRVNSLEAAKTGAYRLSVSETGHVPDETSATLREDASAPATSPFDTPAVFVGGNEGSVYFGLPIEGRRDGLSLFPILQMLKTQQAVGHRRDGSQMLVDAILTQWTVDCANNLIRRGATSGYLGRDHVTDVTIDEPLSTPAPGTIGVGIVAAACHSDRSDWQTGFTDHASKIARMRASS